MFDVIITLAEKALEWEPQLGAPIRIIEVAYIGHNSYGERLAYILLPGEDRRASLAPIPTREECDRREGDLRSRGIDPDAHERSCWAPARPPRAGWR